MSDDEQADGPNFDDLSYEIALDTVARSFLDLRKRGLSTQDAAAIVAAIMTQGTNNGKDFNNE